MYIYAEYLLLENLIINYIILYVTKKFTRTETSKVRLIIASIIGALYALVVFYPSLAFMTKAIFKLSVSVLIIIIAFNPAKLIKFLKLVATFYIISFIFAGAALGLFYFSNVDAFIGGGIFYIKDFPIKILVFAIITSYLLIKFSWDYIISKITKAKNFVPVTIDLNDKKVDIIALLDTGNALKDPISKFPVIVVQFSAIKELLPENVQSIFNKYNENNLDIISTIMSGYSEELRFRLIPFKSLGKENGMLLGFKPDRVVVRSEDERVLSEIVVGIYNSSLSNNDEYMGLLHPEILN